jgi:hypothetical protein
MTGNELISLFNKGCKRCHLTGTVEAGVIVGLDLEGRLFTVLNGEVVNRVNPDAITGITDRHGYLNPGGDGLWPAPEGTCMGYEYATGNWRVPPGLTGAKYKVVDEEENKVVIEAEVDLINASGRGIATVFRRAVSITPAPGKIAVNVVETIKYIGAETLTRQECLIAPWTLCQFDCGPGCEVVFPEVAAADVWDMYDPSDSHRYVKNGLYHAVTDATLRYQIGLSPKVPWIKLVIPEKKLTVTRSAQPLPAGQSYIDIVDAPPEVKPSDKAVRYSVYSDTSGFMEIEAAGGCPASLKSGTGMSVEVTTEYNMDN